VIRRRVAVALVAATSTTLALVAPVQAQEPSSLSSTTEAPEKGNDLEGLPDMLMSAVVDGETALVLEVIRAIMALGLAVTQGATIILPLIPGGTDQLRNFFGQFGIQV